MKTVFLLFILFTRSWAAPQVHLGSTLVTGSHLPLLRQDFFAGKDTQYMRFTDGAFTELATQACHSPKLR